MKRRFVGRLSLFVLVTFLSMSKAGAQELTISNNLLYDATLTPNLQMGVQVSPKWSIGVTGGFRHWPIGNLTKTKWRHLLISPEVRHWTDSLQIGHFFGMNAIYSHFNAGYSDFVIYKGGFLAMDTGTRTASGFKNWLDDCWHDNNYTAQSIAHNVVLIRMEGEKWVGWPAQKYAVANTSGMYKPLGGRLRPVTPSTPRTTVITSTMHSATMEPVVLPRFPLDFMSIVSSFLKHR